MTKSDKEFLIAILKSIKRMLEEKEKSEAIDYVGNIINDFTNAKGI